MPLLRDHKAAGVPLVCGQGQLRREALRLRQRLVVDTGAPRRPAPSRKTHALWLPSSRNWPLSKAALLLEICSLLQPAQFFVKKNYRTWQHMDS